MKNPSVGTATDELYQLKSPIFSGFAELLDGVISVRAFSVEARFMKQLCERVDKTHSAFYYYWVCFLR